jgi:tetratricopeptide (TPR) repeat protein
MRTTLFTALFLVFWHNSALKSQAGLYNPAEFDHVYPLPARFDQFQLTLSDLRGLANQEQPQLAASAESEQTQVNDWIVKYRQRFEELKASENAGSLSIADRIELSARYLRIPKANGSFQTEEAIRVLEPVLAQEPRNFMVLANLAVAHQLAGNLERAVSYEGLALEAWPDAQPGITADQLRWYRRAEKFYYLLLMLRLREMEQPTRSEDKTIDALFNPVDLARSDGTYEAGKISPRQWAELPGDALPLVEQLLVWLPLDNRLYWLLGEVLNARGDVSQAFEVLNTLVNPPNQMQKTNPNPTLSNQPVQPRLLRLHWRILSDDPRAQTKAIEIDPPAAPSANDKATTSWIPDLRAVAVGFAAGVVVSLLAGLQLREFRRRREMRAGRPPAAAG